MSLKQPQMELFLQTVPKLIKKHVNVVRDVNNFNDPTCKQDSGNAKNSNFSRIFR